jgi:predicted AAA+ superfamily ATPase
MRASLTNRFHGAILAKDIKEKASLKDQICTRLLALLPKPSSVDWQTVSAAVWRSQRWHAGFVSHSSVDDITLDDLIHIDDQKSRLVGNTQQFLAGLPANNVLLWGARGTGKSSLVHALLNEFSDDGLRLVEVHKSDLTSLAEIVTELAELPHRFIVFCDDLSFEIEDASYKELKSALEGSIFKTARNVLIYATSNRRHLVPEYMSDNQTARMVDGELHEGEAVEEKISLSDRFGVWLSFYPFKQDAYLVVVKHWVAKIAAEHEVHIDVEDLDMRGAALRWALARGVRNGRTAQYFARDWVGQKSLTINGLN